MIVLILVGLLHARGYRLYTAAVRRSGRDVRPWKQQARLFRLSLVLLFIAIQSPIDYWSDYYLTAHMVQHILLMLVIPPILVLGAPWVPLLRGLPRSWRLRLGRLAQGWRSQDRWQRLRVFLTAPMLSVWAFNVAMVFWHLPGPFDYAATHLFVHIVGEHGTLFGFGVLFWLQIFGSYPFRPVMSAPRRAFALAAANLVMVAVAVALGMLSNHAYSVYANVPHRVMSQGTDQSLAAGILWICGEFTLAPALYFVVQGWFRQEEAAADEADSLIRLTVKVAP